MINGRILGNLLGEFTCYTAQGKSAVDYLLASPSFIPEIKSMFILDLVPTLSDHTPIKFCIKINTCLKDDCAITKLNPLPDKIIWNKDKSDKFELYLQSDEYKQIFADLVLQDCPSNQTTIDNFTNTISDAMINAAKKAEMECKVTRLHKGVRKKVNRCRHPKWYEESCSLAFKNIQNTSKLLKIRPNDPYLRGLLSKETKFYKKLTKQKQSEFTKNIFRELDHLESKDPRA